MKYKVRKQISVLMLAAVVICLIGSLPVQAAAVDGVEYDYVLGNLITVTTQDCYTVEFTSEPSSYMPLLIKGMGSTYSVYYLSHEYFSYDVSHVLKKDDGNISYSTSHYSSSSYVVKNAEGSDVHIYYSSPLIYDSSSWNLSGSYYGILDRTSYSNIQDFNQDLYNIYTGKTDIPGYEVNVPEFSDSQALYSTDLGHLQNIICSTLVTDSNAVGDKTNNTANRYSGNKTWKYTYSYATSTGFDLRQDGADVQYCVKIKGGYTTMTGSYNSLPTVVSDYCYVGNECNYFYIGANGLSLNDLYAEFRTDASMWAKTIDDTVYVYMRPVYCNGSKWTYGEWAKFYFKDGSFVNDGVVEIGTTSTGGISSEDDGVEDDFQTSGTDIPQVSIGEGTDLDDAESNVKPSGSSASIGDDVFQNIQSLVSQIGQIPAIIAKIFSFLPSWCLALVAVGFSMVVFLIIYKLIRG